MKPLKRLSTQNLHSVQLQKSSADKIILDQNVDMFHCTPSEDYNAFSYYTSLRAVRDVPTTAPPFSLAYCTCQHSWFPERTPVFFLLLSFALTTLLYFSRFSHTSPFWLSQPVPATVQRAFTVLFRLVLLSERETDREMEKRNKYSSKFPVSWTRFRFLTERLKGHFTGKWNESWEAWWCYFWSQRLHWLQSQHVPTFERAGNPPFIF